MKICRSCGVPKEESEFYPYSPAKCKQCCIDYAKARVASMTSEQLRARENVRLLYHFGITIERYEEMFAAQDGLCLICSRPETALDRTRLKIRRLAVDHDRRCCPGKRSCGECVRGLLCANCNTRLGYFEDLGVFDSLVRYVGADSTR